jgi:hypothetical protein
MMTLHVEPAAVAGPHAPWCPDDDTRHSVRARRNVLAALWAGRLMGLSGAALTAYAVAVHVADHAVAGDADVAGKIAADLNRMGLPIPESTVRDKLGLFHREALLQLSATD